MEPMTTMKDGYFFLPKKYDVVLLDRGDPLVGRGWGSLIFKTCPVVPEPPSIQIDEPYFLPMMHALRKMGVPIEITDLRTGWLAWMRRKVARHPFMMSGRKVYYNMAPDTNLVRVHKKKRAA